MCPPAMNIEELNLQHQAAVANKQNADSYANIRINVIEASTTTINEDPSSQDQPIESKFLTAELPSKYLKEHQPSSTS